jgi:anti-sigma factor RsiW
VRCDELEPLMEAIADGTIEPSPDDSAHLSSCPACSARLAEARRIDQWLSARELPQPMPAFTAAVMARIGDEKWKTERVVDIGFNVFIAAGVLVFIAFGAGLAWSLGFLTVTLDTEELLRAVFSQVEGRVISQLQTTAIAAVVLTMALALWWWAEAATD